MMNREPQNRNLIKRLYGGLNMVWPAVILFAVGTAVLTAIFLIIPVFKDTSFIRMGVTVEAWIFFAVLIMANTKSPLESACKTFVFFLVSQPLIYLFQVLFSSVDWSIFSFYGYWFKLTLLTFPGAYAGWYITKKNWLSALILAPVLAFLGITAYQSLMHCIRHFPYQLITCLFCLMQIILYVTAFLPGKKGILGAAIPLFAALFLYLTVPEADVNGAVFLPDDPVLTDSAEIIMEDSAKMTITIENTGTDSMVRVQATTFGSTDFIIRDGETEYLYTAEVYEDEGGHSQIRIIQQQP